MSNCFATNLMPYVIISTCANRDHVMPIIHFSGTTQDNTMNYIPASALTLLEVLDNLSI